MNKMEMAKKGYKGWKRHNTLPIYSDCRKLAALNQNILKPEKNCNISSTL